VPGPVLEWRQAAREDLLAIVDYISDDNPAAATLALAPDFVI
jgi:plasmid stabilization system protein ParE